MRLGWPWRRSPTSGGKAGSAPPSTGVDGVGLLCAGIVFIVFGLFQLAPGCIASLEDSRFRTEGVVVQGTVTGKPSSKRTWTVNYRFVTAADHVVEGSDRMDLREWMGVQVGGPVTVVYLRSRPESNRAVARVDDGVIRFTGREDVIFGLVVVGAGVVLLALAVLIPGRAMPLTPANQSVLTLELTVEDEVRLAVEKALTNWRPASGEEARVQEVHVWDQEYANLVGRDLWIDLEVAGAGARSVPENFFLRPWPQVEKPPLDAAPELSAAYKEYMEEPDRNEPVPAPLAPATMAWLEDLEQRTLAAVARARPGTRVHVSFSGLLPHPEARQ